MTNPCRPGMCLINDMDERATITAIARHAGADDGNRFVVTAGHACKAGQAVSYFPLDSPRTSVGKCVGSLYPQTDLCSIAATDATTWGAPFGFGWEPDLFADAPSTLQGVAAIFLGSKQQGPLQGTLGTPVVSGSGFTIDFNGATPVQTWPGDSGGALYIRSPSGGLLLVGMLISQAQGAAPSFQFPGPGLSALGLVLVT